MEIIDIQQLINEKADAKLEKALNNLEKVVCNGENYELLKTVRLNIGSIEKPKSISLAYIFSTDGFKKQLFTENMERYRNKETTEFLKQVESLREDVDNLLNV